MMTFLGFLWMVVSVVNTYDYGLADVRSIGAMVSFQIWFAASLIVARMK